MYDQVVSYVIILSCLHFSWGCCGSMCVCVCQWALTSASLILTDFLAEYTQFLLECNSSSILEAWVQYNSIHSPRRTQAMVNWDARSNFVINRNSEQENVFPSLHFSPAVTLVSATHWPPAPWSQATLPLLRFCCMFYSVSLCGHSLHPFQSCHSMIPAVPALGLLGLCFLSVGQPLLCSCPSSQELSITSGYLPLPPIKLSFLDLECRWGNHIALSGPTINSVSNLCWVLQCRPSSSWSALHHISRSRQCQPLLSDHTCIPITFSPLADGSMSCLLGSRAAGGAVSSLSSAMPLASSQPPSALGISAAVGSQLTGLPVSILFSQQQE